MHPILLLGILQMAYLGLCRGVVLSQQQLLIDILDTSGSPVESTPGDLEVWTCHCSYDKRVRPVRNMSQPVTVQHRMNFYQGVELLEVNEPRQKLVLYVWVVQAWTDQFLGWDPAKYEGIQRVVLPWESVWLPDTYLYNSLKMNRVTMERITSVTYTTRQEGNGTKWVADAQMLFPAIYRVSCKMNIRAFPFDLQNCTLIFGSWTFDSSGIDFVPTRDHVGFESYVSNEEWRVLSFQYHRRVVDYECCPQPWTLLEASLIMQRKPLYYIVNLIFPTAVITFIAVVGFFMPTSTTGERVEKVNLGINTLLAMSILLLMVSGQIPTTSDLIPLMSWYFLLIMILISAGTVTTSLIILLNQQANHGSTPPPWLLTREVVKTGALRLGSLLFVNRPAHLRPTRPCAPKNRRVVATNGPTLAGGELRKLVDASPDKGQRKDNVLVDKAAAEEDVSGPITPYQPLLDQLQRAVDKCHFYLKEREWGWRVGAEWGFVCAVLDRVCLLLYTLAVGALTAWLLCSGHSDLPDARPPY